MARAKPMRSSLALATGAALLLALAAPICVDWTSAQKTAGRTTYQQVASSSPDEAGNNPVSVYGGYQSSSSYSSSSSSSAGSPRKSIPAPVSASRRVSSSSSSYNRQQVQQQPQPQPIAQQSLSSSRQQVVESSYSEQQAEADAEPPSYGAVAGVPGRDFPNYARVPKTSFSCEGLPYSDYGYYADVETGCQAYHVCYAGRKDSFLCGPGTVFNQRILHCDYWYSVDCANSSQYYSSSNAYMGSSQPEPGPAQASGSAVRRTQQSSSSSRTNYARPANAFVPQEPTRQVAASNSFSRNTQQVQEEVY